MMCKDDEEDKRVIVQAMNTSYYFSRRFLSPFVGYRTNREINHHHRRCLLSMVDDCSLFVFVHDMITITFISDNTIKEMK